MEIRLDGIVVIVGNYGSGKTEVAVNLAVVRRSAGIEVRIADLDLVNPYFRTREARKQLEARGVGVVLPEDQYLNADLPILSPRIAGLIRSPAPLTIIDVGGDDVGATVLASLADAFGRQDFQMLQVVNPYRPFTETIEGCLKIQAEIEASSRQAVTGWVANPHLLDETVADDVYQGADFVNHLAERTGLPLVFVTAPAELVDGLDAERIGRPLLSIRRQLVPPWKQAVQLPGIISKVAAAAKTAKGV